MSAQISRRLLLKGSLLLGSAVSVSACAGSMPMGGMNHGNMSSAATAAPGSAHEMPYLLSGRPLDPAFKPDLDLELSAQPVEAMMRAGAVTRAWGFVARVLSGDASQVSALPGASLGPLIRARTGQKIRIRYTNKLPGTTASNIHWHGLRPPQIMDGHPDAVVASGQSFVYEFEITDAALTAWFHPHAHGDTGRQVNMGLAGMFIVSDEAERALGLPSGEHDLPIIIQDRTFDKDNQLIYFGQGMMGGAMDQMMGFYGDEVCVNGKTQATQSVSASAYRLRVLNGSNARPYKLAWSDGRKVTVIGTDDGLLAAAVERDYVMLSPGERVEVWVDFSKLAVGQSIKLVSKEFSGVENIAVPATLGPQMGGVSQMMMAGGALEVGHGVDLMTFAIIRTGVSAALPEKLRPVPAPKLADAGNAATPRAFEVTHKGMDWMFNGRRWDSTIQPYEKVSRGATEVWSFENKLNLGEMMDPMGMAHPIHLHGVHFKILERTLVVPELAPGYETVRNGFVDDGMKDTFLLMPGERVKFLVSFGQEPGKYVYHCHNLEHEDQGLMRNYLVS